MTKPHAGAGPDTLAEARYSITGRDQAAGPGPAMLPVIDCPDARLAKQ